MNIMQMFLIKSLCYHQKYPGSIQHHPNWLTMTSWHPKFWVVQQWYQLLVYTMIELNIKNWILRWHQIQAFINDAYMANREMVKTTKWLAMIRWEKLMFVICYAYWHPHVYLHVRICMGMYAYPASFICYLLYTNSTLPVLALLEKLHWHFQILLLADLYHIHNLSVLACELIGLLLLD